MSEERHELKIRAGWRTRMVHGVATRDDYEVYKSYVLRRYIAGETTEVERDRALERARDWWRASPHYDGKD